MPPFSNNLTVSSSGVIRSSSLRSYRLFDCLWIAILVGLVWWVNLLGHPLSVPDSARYAEIPREMFESGDWITPHLNGVKYFEKPPLFYWLQLIAFKLGGVSDNVAMIPNFLLSVAIVVTTYLLGEAIFERKSGIFSALILASNLGSFVFTRVLTLDILLSFTLTVAIGSFWLAYLQTVDGAKTKNDRANSSRGCLWLAYLASAGAVMSKGLVGALFPILILGGWFLLVRDWKLLKRWLYWPAILLTLFLVLPWHLLVQYRHPEFLDFYIIKQHMARFFTDYAARKQPWWFFGAVLLVSWYPWSALFPAVLQNLFKRWRSRWEQFGLVEWDIASKSELFAFLWAMVIIVFFNFSQSKLIPYILPAFPPIALLMGGCFLSWWQRPIGRSSQVTCLMWTNGLLALGGAIMAIWFFDVLRMENGNLFFWKVSFIWAGVAATLGVLKWRRREMISGYAILIAAIGALAIFHTAGGYAYNINHRSIYQLVQVLQNELTDRDTVIAYQDYYQELPFYLQCKVVVVGDGGELNFGAQHQPEAKGWMWQHDKFDRCMILADSCKAGSDREACKWLRDGGCLLRDGHRRHENQLGDSSYVGHYYLLAKWPDWEEIKNRLPIIANWRVLARERDVILVTDKPGE